jgi:hypothetical protein
MNQQPQETSGEKEVLASAYEAPHIESVLTPDELEREVLYAGSPVTEIPGDTV